MMVGRISSSRQWFQEICTQSVWILHDLTSATEQVSLRDDMRPRTDDMRPRTDDMHGLGKFICHWVPYYWNDPDWICTQSYIELLVN